MEAINDIKEEIFKLCDQFIKERQDRDMPDTDGITCLEVLQECFAETINKVLQFHIPALHIPFKRNVVASRGESLIWTLEMLHFGVPELTEIIRKISGKFDKILVILEASENPAF